MSSVDSFDAGQRKFMGARAQADLHSNDNNFNIKIKDLVQKNNHSGYQSVEQKSSIEHPFGIKDQHQFGSIETFDEPHFGEYYQGEYIQ